MKIPYAVFGDSDLNSSYVGGTSDRFDAMFACCQLLQPVLVLLDEADVFFPAPGRGTEHAVRDVGVRKPYLSGDQRPVPGLLVLLATNQLGSFDTAIKSRLTAVEVPPPTPEKQRLVWARRLQHSHFADRYDNALLDQLISRDVPDLRLFSKAITNAEEEAINAHWGQEPVYDVQQVLFQLDKVYVASSYYSS